jgi:hypothetical protein
LVVLSELFDGGEVLVLWLGRVFVGGTESGRGAFGGDVDFVFEVEFGEDAVLDGFGFGEFVGLKWVDDVVPHHLAVAQGRLDLVFEVVRLKGFLFIDMLKFLNQLVQVIDILPDLG